MIARIGSELQAARGTWRLELVSSGYLDRRRCGACFTHRSRSAVDLLPAGIVQRASTLPSAARERGSDARGATGDRRHSMAPSLRAARYSTGPSHDQCGRVRSSGTNSGRS